MKIRTSLLHHLVPYKFRLFGSGLVPLATLVLLASTLTLPEAGAAEIDNEGRVRIGQIALSGDAIYPEYGVSRDFIDKRVQQIRSHFGERLSIQEMYAVAEAITLAYQEKGLTFHRAWVVPQEIRDGQLEVHVQGGLLAEIEVLNGSMYSQQQIRSALQSHIGNILYEPRLQTAIAEINDWPGLDVFAFFSVGAKRGESLLNLRVQRESRHEFEFRVDNHGVAETGEHRLLSSWRVNNPLRMADALDLTAMLTEERDNLYGSLSWRRPFGRYLQWGLFARHSQFELSGEFDGLALAGELSEFGTEWQVTAPGSNTAVDTWSPAATLRLSLKDSSVSSATFPSFFDDEVEYAQADLVFDTRLRTSGSSPHAHQVQIRPSYGQVLNTSRQFAIEDLWWLQIAYRYQHQNWFDIAELNHVLELNVEGQASLHPLPAAERWVTSGPQRNRGFEPALFSGDWGLHWSVEEHLPGLGRWPADIPQIALSPFLFYDYSRAGQKTASQSATLQSAGLGVRMSWGRGAQSEAESGLLDQANLELTLGYPLSRRPASLPGELDDSVVVYAQISLGIRS